MTSTTISTPTFRSAGTEWAESVVAEGSELHELRNVLVEVSVRGKAEAARLSLGPFRDFLVPVEPAHGERRLQLEIDGVARMWAFRADGILIGREWWDAAVTSVDDLFGGTLTVKACTERKAANRKIAGVHVFVEEVGWSA
jgi:hypothetical protein